MYAGADKSRKEGRELGEEFPLEFVCVAGEGRPSQWLMVGSCIETPQYSI